MPKAVSKKKAAKTISPTRKNDKKLKIRVKIPTWKGIKESKITKYTLLVLAILVSFVVVDFGVQYLNNGYSVVVVNGVRVSKKEYFYRLDQAYGSSIATQLIQEELIKQEAQKEGITASDEEIQDEVDGIADQLGGVDQLDISLDAYNLTMEDLTEQIRMDILARKILEPSIEYTEDDVKSFFEQYSDVIFAEEASLLEDGELLDYDTHREKTLEIFLQQEIETAKSAWLSTLQSEAKVQNNVVDKPVYKFLGATRNIITNMISEANSNESTEDTVEE